MSNFVGRVEALWRYPVSSVGGERMTRVQFTHAGPIGDRLFGIFDDATGDIVFPSRQKHWNVAPMISARLDADGALWLSVDGRVWLSSHAPALRKALSGLFGRAVSVFRYGTDIAGQWAGPRYQQSPVHLLSRQSIEALKRLLPVSVIDERRFRPNILVDFDTKNRSPTPEYNLIGREFQIGNLRLKGTQECGRCSFTTLEQVGLPEDRTVLRALIGNFEKDFGIYCDVLTEGWVACGDELTMQSPAETGERIVIVGAGQAGGIAAKTLRELGHRGPITVFGDERHSPYERPPLSKNFQGHGTSYRLTDVLSGKEAAQLEVSLHLNETIVHIDRRTRTVENSHGARHSYGKLLIATGGSPRRRPLLSRGCQRVHTIRTAQDAEVLRASLAHAKRIFVLGGGWLGLEIAAAARAMSISVDLFVRDARVCSRVLPKAVSDFIAEVHRQHGVTLHVNTQPAFDEQPSCIEAFLQRSNRSCRFISRGHRHPPK
ncbi:MOSC domain-containing protein [Sinorhizobium meliloti]|uniref:FAD-dependent oxidoreductase n=1 Tax=Rhizobium meliloti TaxID=382 RepID=UPI000FD94ECC|nr:FAD-dependent oxidoreductase [Sinorhizobium meliloti]RVI92431.1 MOSC domain-containing protein [Sinorhizobium meliloti]